MENMFKNAFFGKRYITRDGHKAIYLFPYDCIIKTTHNLVVNVHHDDTHLCEIVTNDEGRVGSMESPFDIVSEWEDHINEEEIDKLAALYELNHDDIPPYANTDTVWNLIRDAYKDGCKETFKRLS